MAEDNKIDTKYVNVTGKFLSVIRYLSSQTPGVWLVLISYWYFKKKKEGKEAQRVNKFVKPSLESQLLSLNIGKPKLVECLRELEILGFIKEVKQERIKGRIGQVSNLYFLDDDPEVTLDKLDKLWAFQNIKESKNSRKRNYPDELFDLRIDENEE